MSTWTLRVRYRARKGAIDTGRQSIGLPEGSKRDYRTKCRYLMRAFVAKKSGTTESAGRSMYQQQCKIIFHWIIDLHLAVTYYATSFLAECVTSLTQQSAVTKSCLEREKIAATTYATISIGRFRQIVARPH